MIDLRRDGDVFVLTMQAGENRFNRPFVEALNEALDTVEASPGPAALVTTGGHQTYATLKRGIYADLLETLQRAGR